MQWKTCVPPADCTGRAPARPNLPAALRRLGRLLALVSVLGFLGTVGCGSGKKTPTTARTVMTEKQKLRIGWPKEGDPSLFRDFIARWAADHKTGVDLVRYDPLGESAQLPDVDLCLLAPAELARWAAGGQLLPLPPLLERGQGFRDPEYLSVYRQFLTWGEKRYALPVRGEALLCVYRADLFSLHGAAFAAKVGRPLQPPRTWEELEQIAAFFHAGTGANGNPSTGLPPLPAGDRELEREFYTVAASFVRRGLPTEGKSTLAARYSFQFDVETGEPLIATAGFVHAVQVLQRLQTYRVPQATSEPLSRFRDGHAVLCLAPLSPWISRFQTADAAVRNKFGFAPVPGSRFVFDSASGERSPCAEPNRVPYLGADGWLGVVPKATARADAAFALLRWLNDPQIAREVAVAPGSAGPFRMDHRLTSLKWDELTFGPRMNELVEALGTTVENPQVSNPTHCLRTPDELRFHQVLVARLRPAIVENQDASKALQEVAAAWREIIRKKGAAIHRADYRRSLGLDP